MSCCLSLSTTGEENFLAKSGSKVTIAVKAIGDARAEILHIQYAGDPLDDEEPFEFTVKPGPKRLSLLIEASKPGASLQIIESCGDDEPQVLDSFFFDPGNPGVGYVVRGTTA
jgi:hypothetical protein